MPWLPETHKDPTQSGFKSKKEAEKYIVSRICEACRHDKNKEWAGMNSPCAAEWLVVPEDLFKEAIDFVDLFKAAGYKKIK